MSNADHWANIIQSVGIITNAITCGMLSYAINVHTNRLNAGGL